MPPKRPTIVRRTGAPQPRELSYHEQVAQAQAAAKEAYYKKLKQIKPSRFPWIQKFRKRKERPLFSLSGLQTTLFNADGICQHTPDPVDIFNDIIQSPGEHPEIESASLKGGRFKELARYNRKGVVEFKGGKPNQVGILFIIDGKKNYVNIFDNASIRWGGSSLEYKVYDFITDYVGKINHIVYSNHSGQLHVDKKLNIQRLAELTDLKWFGKGSRIIFDKPSQMTLQLADTEFKRLARPGPRMATTVARIGNLEFQNTETKHKNASITFFNSGIIQYQGKYVNTNIIVDILVYIFTRLQNNGIFVGESGPRVPKVQKSKEYKTRSRNPPNPPNSFEGTCEPGYYCRPNAQGFPTCYIIPTINESSRKTVIESYKAAGAQIPKAVKDIFKIDTKEPDKYEIPMTIEKQTYRDKTVSVLKIGGRQAMRMTEDQLEDVARKKHIPGIVKGLGVTKMVAKMTAHILKKDEPYINQKDKLRIGERLCDSWSKQQLLDLGYPGVHKDMTVEQICTRIEYFTRGIAENKHNFELEGTKFRVEGDKILGATRRNGKPNPGRKCATIPTETLYKYARAMGIDPKGKSKPEICKEMQEKKLASRMVRVEQVKEAAPAPEPTKLEKITEKFEQLLGFKEYDKKKLKEWLLAAPHQRKIIIRDMRHEHALEKFVSSLEPGQFKDDVKRYARDNPSIEKVKEYAMKLKETREKLEKGEHTVTAFEKETRVSSEQSYKALLRSLYKHRTSTEMLDRVDSYEKKRGLGTDVDRYARRHFPDEYWKSISIR